MFKTHKEKIHRFFIGGKQFKREFKKQVRLLIIVTLGFTIAFSWRQTIFDVFQTLVQRVVSVTSQSVLSVLTSLALTIISFLLIFIASYFLQETSAGY